MAPYLQLAETTMDESRDLGDKYWKLESLDNTLSTVESDGLSVSSDEEDIICEVPYVVETPKQKYKKVCFSLEEEDEVRCTFKEIERVANPDLWWNEEECSQILDNCARVVQFYQSRSRMCSSLTNYFLSGWISNHNHPFKAILEFLEEQHPEVTGRGLEQHIVGSVKGHVQRHRLAILETQDRFIGTEWEDSAQMWEEIRHAAELTSEECKDLARRVALLDELAASDEDESVEEDYF